MDSVYIPKTEFVLGCDIKKTEYLKEKYWTEK